MRGCCTLLVLHAAPAISAAALDAADARLEAVVVTDSYAPGDALGSTSSASAGLVEQQEIQSRPLSRVGELVEVVPGAIATQHSGSGKANQFFLRGFNLDHGTDFSIAVDGVPMNMPSHAHGQGYLDLNSVIPELVDHADYGKGPYYADVGDFASAGYARLYTADSLPQGFVKFTGGEFDYYRTVAADSQKLGWGELLYGAEAAFYDGPWQTPEGSGKYNGLLKYSLAENDWGLSLVGKAYHADWTATNPVPQRAVDSGMVDRYGNLGSGDGGNSSRYSASGSFWSRGETYKNAVNLYAVYYDVDLWSNFTYFLDHPLRGDQVEQTERRIVLGGNGEQTWYGKAFGLDIDNALGMQVRHDHIMGVALNHSQDRRVFNTVRRDDIDQTNVGLYGRNQIRWLEKFRTVAGLRGDFFVFDVNSRTLAANSGVADAAIFSPKLSLIFGPWYDTEFFINLGESFHSNDARGVTLKFDPTSPTTPLPGVYPLVKSRGAEVGLRSQYLPGLDTTLALWWMRMDSELVFIGDAGTTEPSGKSQRYGVEWTNTYKPTGWLTLDGELALTNARFTDAPGNADAVPNSVGRVIGAGATLDLPRGFFAGARLRHFGHVPLNEQASADGGSTTLVSLEAGYKNDAFKLALDVFNLLDSRRNDIAYYYGSRLAGEPAGGVEDVHFHPVEPRMVRASVTVYF
ncbi:MAG: TonB-dependent receptor [Methylococcaceae bacterium]|nr:MAG: TonB-dependent receptor [Methylococcaceae bacterium]